MSSKRAFKSTRYTVGDTVGNTVGKAANKSTKQKQQNLAAAEKAAEKAEAAVTDHEEENPRTWRSFDAMTPKERFVYEEAARKYDSDLFELKQAHIAAKRALAQARYALKPRVVVTARTQSMAEDSGIAGGKKSRKSHNSKKSRKSKKSRTTYKRSRR